MSFEYESLGPAPLNPKADQVMVSMRDGVRLATDIYLPDGHRPVPTVLVRLPYDKCGRYTFMPQLAPYFTERGYAFVAQDVRGKFRSEGETMPFAHEVEDGYDTLEWVSAQPWCDGQVGMWGDSYYGYTQWAAVASGHPALKAIVPRVTSTNFQVLNWWGDSVVLLYAAQYLAECWLDNNMYTFQPDWSTRPIARIYEEAFAAVGRRSACYDLMLGLRQPDKTGHFFKVHPFEALRIPVLHSVGWFDNISPYSFADYETLMAGSKRGLQYLVADAADHEMYHLRHAPITKENDHYVDDQALARMIPEIVGPGLEFFEVFLKGTKGANAVPRARWFLGNAGWRTSSHWPPPENRELRLYLGVPQRATESVEGGVLLPAPDAASAEAQWVHDPANLVPSTTDDPFALLHDWSDERTVQGRSDVLTFTGEALSEPLDLAGPVSAHLVLGSTGPTMHAHVKLSDVFPDGSAHMLARGQSLIRQADYGHPVNIGLSHIGHRLLPGHRLRLSIASSDFPLYLWHPGTDDNPWSATKGVANRQTLATGAASPSHVRLTVIPVGDDPGDRLEGKGEAL